MPRDGSQTRERLLDAAETLILGRGFAGTSVEAILERAGVTKGAFFHHFPSKADLALALVERYAALDAALVDSLLERAERHASDPLRQVLVFVDLFEKELERVAGPPPSCLLASYCYEAQLFDEETLTVIRRSVADWRRKLGAKLREVALRHPPRRDVDPEALADLLWTVFEGSFVLARATGEADAVLTQLRLYRTHLELLFDAA